MTGGQVERQPAGEDGMRDVRVATYNIYLGADLALLFGATSFDELGQLARVVREQVSATDFTERAAAIARILSREAADVVGLQEVTRWSSGDELIVDFLPVLLAALEDAGCGYDVHAVNESFAGGLPVEESWMSVSGSNVALVRRGGRFTVTASRADRFSAFLDMPTGLDGVTFPIVRGWSLVEGLVDGRSLRVVNTHTEAYDAGIRDAQRDELLDLVTSVDGAVVLLGDFNAQPSSVGMPAPWRDSWIEAGGLPEVGFTCGQSPDLRNEASALHERIDYVFVRGAGIRDCRVVGDVASERTTSGLWPSDHAGVVADLTV